MHQAHTFCTKICARRWRLRRSAKRPTDSECGVILRQYANARTPNGQRLIVKLYNEELCNTRLCCRTVVGNKFGVRWEPPHPLGASESVRARACGARKLMRVRCFVGGDRKARQSRRARVARLRCWGKLLHAGLRTVRVCVCVCCHSSCCQVRPCVGVGVVGVVVVSGRKSGWSFRRQSVFDDSAT